VNASTTVLGTAMTRDRSGPLVHRWPDIGARTLGAEDFRRWELRRSELCRWDPPEPDLSAEVLSDEVRRDGGTLRMRRGERQREVIGV
jgi:hypothetical protein